MRITLKTIVVTTIILFATLVTNCTLAQNRQIDSLNNLLNLHSNKDEKRASILYDLAVSKMRIDINKSFEHIDEIISFQDKIAKKKLVANTYRVKAILQYFTSKFPEALESLNNALKIDNALKDNSGIGKDLSTMGLVYMAQSKFPEALRCYLAALTKFDAKKDELDIAATNSNIGTIYNEMGNLSQAMENYQKSYVIHKKHKNYINQVNTLTNMASIFYKKKDLNEAIKYSKLSLKLADSIADLGAIARESGNLSGYYSHQMQPDLALTYGLKATEINKKLKNKRSLAYNYVNVSSAYYKKEDYKQSKIYGLMAYNIGKELNITEITRDASLGLSEVYEAVKMPDSALFYHKAFYKFADSIGSDKKKTEITRMGIQYDFDKKELSYQQKQSLADAQLKQQSLQLALNNAELQKTIQLRDLQRISLENEKLINQEKEKQLIIAKNKEKLQANRVNALSQAQKLNKLELKQLWLYGALAILVLASVIVYLINLYRIRQLRFKNTLQKQEALQNELLLKHQFQLTESELKAIRSQMNPHFIFNVLNSIESYVMDNDKRTASRLIQKFASLTRLILENSTKSLVSADREWKALKLYTELEAMRYNDSFTFNFYADEDLQLNTLLLPPMLVQPLIENAILHGLIGSRKPDSHLEVRLKKHDNGINITVEDNGTGIVTEPKANIKFGIKEKSMGLASIKERIAVINAQKKEIVASFKITSKPETGTTASIFLPYFDNAVA